MKTRKAYSVPKEQQALYDQITGLTDEFCSAHLNAEYVHVCREMTAALCRKRPSPLVRGKLEIWAAAIIHTVAGVNFAYDRSQTPHITLDELCEALGTAKTTVGSKAGQIRKVLKIGTFDPQWTVASMMDRNPIIWMLSVNGFLVDIRTMPLEAQQVAFEKGLIPYIPALRTDQAVAGDEA
ncbi:MAG: DUF6398 domain-containing protein [Chloroflexi bacterium]|nr:DUF6398 domain-containing protein [Chloroflexota bacterium]